MTDTPATFRRGVPLAELTTLGLGGAAEYFVRATEDAELVEAFRWAARRGMPARVLGGGSNLIVPDAGVEGLVVHVARRGVATAERAGEVLVTAAAGEPWDELVSRAVAEGWAGLECLSGIPGLVGATPVQNVGAYGHEVAETLARLRVLDRRGFDVVELASEACAFGYRESVLKREPDRWVVLDATFRLRARGAPEVRYAELARALEARREPSSGPAGPRGLSLGLVRETVLALRAAKGMLLEPSGELGRTAGSFFLNPVLDAADAARVRTTAMALGLVARPEQVPSFSAAGGRVKLAAAWLIEQSGFPRGTRRGPVGVSSRHALALVHYGGGTTAELLALAAEIRGAVEARFGVTLEPEPVLWGTPRGIRG